MILKTDLRLLIFMVFGFYFLHSCNSYLIAVTPHVMHSIKSTESSKAVKISGNTRAFENILLLQTEVATGGFLSKKSVLRNFACARVPILT